MPAQRMVNDRGQVRWQPRLEDGRVMYSIFGGIWDCTDLLEGLERLYRSKARAERVARRKQREIDSREERRYYYG